MILPRFRKRRIAASPVSVRFARAKISVAQEIRAKAETRERERERETREVIYFEKLGQLIPPCIRQVGKTGRSGEISGAKIAKKRG